MAGRCFLLHACRMQCQACQTEFLVAAGESVGFREVCDRCRADLHTCLNCSRHDPSAYNECLESSAERVLDQDRANRCEYYRPGGKRHAVTEDRQNAMTDLENLFKK